MKKNMVKLLLLLLIGNLISIGAWAMDEDDFRTPPRPTQKRRCPSSEERDPTFRPGITPESERKRRKVSQTCISSPSVKSWPCLLRRHELNLDFMKRLAEAEQNDGTTMLHKAMKQVPTPNTLSCAEDMITTGSDLTAKQAEDRETPLHRWAMCPTSNTDAVQAISAALQQRTCPAGADLKNIHGNTPLHLLCSKGLLNYAKFEVLARWGIPLGIQNYCRQTVLHRLAQAGQDMNDNKAGILEFLSHQDLSSIINLKDWHGRTALHCAVQSGDLSTFDFLAQQEDIKLNRQDENNETALHAAARNTGARKKLAKEFIIRLLRLGACKEIENADGLKPRDLVSERYPRLKIRLS